MPKNDQELVDAIVDREHEKAHKIPLVVSKTEQLTEDTITSKLPEKPELIIFENKDRIVQLEQQLADVTATRRHRKTGGEVMEMIGQVCPKCGEPMAGFCRMCNPDPIKVGRIEQLTEKEEWPVNKLARELNQLKAQYIPAQWNLMIIRLHDSERKLAKVTAKAGRLREFVDRFNERIVNSDVEFVHKHPDGSFSTPLIDRLMEEFDGEDLQQLLADTEELEVK